LRRAKTLGLMVQLILIKRVLRSILYGKRVCMLRTVDRSVEQMQNVRDFTSLTNNELYEEYEKLGRRVMYYAAAEGDWGRETADRMATENEYYTLQKEIRSRGLEI
jgi:hypothetical protein